MNYVYLSGPIGGLTLEEATAWRYYVQEMLPSGIIALSPLRSSKVLEHSGVDDKSINRSDHFDTMRSSVVLVNLLKAKQVSIGTVGEMAWAWDHHIPVVCAMEKDNIHEHPMLNDWITYRAATLDEAILLTVAIINPNDYLK